MSLDCTGRTPKSHTERLQLTSCEASVLTTAPPCCPHQNPTLHSTIRNNSVPQTQKSKMWDSYCRCWSHADVLLDGLTINLQWFKNSQLSFKSLVHVKLSKGENQMCRCLLKSIRQVFHLKSDQIIYASPVAYCTPSQRCRYRWIQSIWSKSKNCLGWVDRPCQKAKGSDSVSHSYSTITHTNHHHWFTKTKIQRNCKIFHTPWPLQRKQESDLDNNDWNHYHALQPCQHFLFACRMQNGSNRHKEKLCANAKPFISNKNIFCGGFALQSKTP